VNRRAILPSIEDVQLAINELAETTGRPPTVLALSRHLGLVNTTFRRNFPDITAELHGRRIAAGQVGDHAAVTRFDQLKHDNRTLRRDNHELTEHLDVAIANIQRLTLENRQLRQQLEAATKIIRIRPHRRPAPDQPQPGSNSVRSC
jgi:hypothetical protein